MPADDLNDVRAALGANGNATRLLREEVAALSEKLDDIGATLARLAPLAEFMMDVKRVVEIDIPDAIDKLADDPLMGALIAPYTSMVRQTLEGGLLRAKANRISAPADERDLHSGGVTYGNQG